MNSSYKLTEEEQRVWDNASAVFQELLADFKAKKLLRLDTIQENRKKLALIWENTRNYGMAFSEIQKVFDSEKSVEALASKSGFSTHTLTYLYVSQLVGVMLVSYESVFKTSLLFFLKEEQGFRRDMTLGQMLRAIKNIFSSAGTKLEKMINTKVRNSVAHGNFWFMEEGKVFLAKNSYLEEVDEISLTDFWIEMKRINIISTAFVETLLQKVREGYFLP